MFPTPHLLMFGGMVLLHVFGMPWLMLDSPGHFRISRGQLYMATVMGLAMVVLEGLMHPMPLWAWILTGTLLVLTCVAIRQQWGIGDTDYLEEMIPHHAMAIFTSQHRLADPNTHPEVRSLAQGILQAQKDEIHYMENLLASTI